MSHLEILSHESRFSVSYIVEDEVMDWVMSRSLFPSNSSGVSGQTPWVTSHESPYRSHGPWVSLELWVLIGHWVNHQEYFMSTRVPKSEVSHGLLSHKCLVGLNHRRLVMDWVTSQLHESLIWITGRVTWWVTVMSHRWWLRGDESYEWLLQHQLRYRFLSFNARRLISQLFYAGYELLCYRYYQRCYHYHTPIYLLSLSPIPYSVKTHLG